MSRPIVLVTGANAGVGLGVCERLLVQLSNPTPPDSAALDSGDHEVAGTPFHAAEGCTLLLACRNQAKAAEAVTHLKQILARLATADDLAVQKNTSPSRWAEASSSAVASASSLRKREFTQDDSAPLDTRTREARIHYRQSFCRGTIIEVIPLDLASLENTKACAKLITDKVPYLTHIILNAGGAAWIGVNWLWATWEILTSLHKAVTFPSYKLQRAGDKSDDGYGWVWQTNVGSHYVLVQALEPLLRRSPYAVPSRVIWTGSLEANRNDFHLDDFQCLDPRISPHPYESTKYQCELAALAMDERYVNTHDAHAPRVYTAHPGIVASSIFSTVIPSIMLLMMKLVFYLARWTFSPHHPIDAYKGAIAATFVAVAPPKALDSTARYGAQCTWTGTPYVHAGRLNGWHESSDGSPDPAIQGLARELLTAYDRILS